MQYEQGGQAVLHVEHGKQTFLSVGKIMNPQKDVGN